jgi:hypothetical protein
MGSNVSGVGSGSGATVYDGSFESIVITQTPEPELEAPDPSTLWGHPADGMDAPPSGGGGGGGGAGAPPVIPEPPRPSIETQPPPPDEGPKPIKTGLGDKIDDILNRSPSLRKQWEEAQAKGWRIELAAYGSGSRADPNKQRIFIDEQDLAKGGHDIASLLSHEMGHAATDFPEPLDPKAHPKDEYVTTTVQGEMEHEGAAAFANARARDEIMHSDGNTEDGPDVGIRGKFDDEYIAIYERYKSGEISEKQAKAEMTEVMSREPAGIDPDGSYITKKEAATQQAAQEWNRQNGQSSTQ